MTTDIGADVKARRHDDAPVTAAKDIRPAGALVAETVTINRPARELYDFWRDTSNLTRIMDNISEIAAIDPKRSRWTVKAPIGREVSWTSVITEDLPGEAITWQSEDGGDVVNNGRIQFIDAGRRGTVVRATIAYEPPGGMVGKLVAKLFQREPRIQARRDLRRFKQFMETGEVATAARTRKQLEEEQG
jgi:uncharacterized membrane protein